MLFIKDPRMVRNRVNKLLNNRRERQTSSKPFLYNWTVSNFLKLLVLSVKNRLNLTVRAFQSSYLLTLKNTMLMSSSFGASQSSFGNRTSLISEQSLLWCGMNLECSNVNIWHKQISLNFLHMNFVSVRSMTRRPSSLFSSSLLAFLRLCFLWASVSHLRRLQPSRFFFSLPFNNSADQGVLYIFDVTISWCFFSLAAPCFEGPHISLRESSIGFFVALKFFSKVLILFFNIRYHGPVCCLSTSHHFLADLHGPFFQMSSTTIAGSSNKKYTNPQHVVVAFLCRKRALWRAWECVIHHVIDLTVIFSMWRNLSRSQSYFFRNLELPAACFPPPLLSLYRSCHTVCQCRTCHCTFLWLSTRIQD